VGKVTSKLQVTVPKAVADRFNIKPGDELVWTAGPDSIRVTPARSRSRRLDPTTRLALFDRATARQREREAATPPRPGAQRGWTRDDLYDRGRPR
jgi:AbrB family looped-hinge helix DNA binding protein